MIESGLILKEMAMRNDQKWVAPTKLPNLKNSKFIGIDTESKDLELMSMGPGSVRGNAHIIGISLANEDGYKCYLPIRHEGGGNLPIEPVLNYVRDLCACENIVFVGANILYDLQLLRVDGIEIRGPIVDIQIAEPLLDEDQFSYSLENLGQRYFGEGKEETLLMEAASRLSVSFSEIKGHLWRLPASYVGPYAEVDAELALRIWLKQKDRISDLGLKEVLQLEMDIVRVLLDMSFKGIRVDKERAEQLIHDLSKEQDESYSILCDMAGQSVDIWSNVSVAGAASSIGLPVPLTEAGNPSFESDFLKGQEHPFFQHLLKIRQLDRAGSIFIEKKILGYETNGRIYPRFRQVRGEGKGTKGGRFSSEAPNLQQVPARNPILAPLVRSCFLPEEGEIWAGCDLSAQEPRLTLHYGCTLELDGANDMLQKFIDNPFTDVHQATADLIKEVTGLRIERSPAKAINLGIAYGMGKGKLADSAGLNKNLAYSALNAYDKALPYVKQLGAAVMDAANKRGFVKTILGRRRNFNLWGPHKWSAGIRPLPFHEACREFGGESKITRYFTYKALNAVIQGSSADQIKKAMVMLWKENLTPSLTLHDELLGSYKNLEEVKQVAHIMCTCLENVIVPFASDIEIGPNWGDVIAKYKYSVKTGLIEVKK